MGGRGTYSTGNNVPFKYKTVSCVCGVKVVARIKNGSQNLPEESHTSKAYILQNDKGEFRRYREYNSDHTAKFDIDYHPEPSLSRTAVYHIHYYVNGVRDKKPRLLTEKEYNKYKKYFGGNK